MIEVQIFNISIMNNKFIIFLKSESDERLLPIFIDESQWQSIMIRIKNIEVVRPGTHDLFKTVLETLEYRVSRVEVSDLRDDTFYARLVLEGNGNSFQFDARPSDAICLALRFEAPIFVDEKVMAKAGVFVVKEKTNEKRDEPVIQEEQSLSPIDILKRKLEQAVLEERYEEAARLRDEINKTAQSN